MYACAHPTSGTSYVTIKLSISSSILSNLIVLLENLIAHDMFALLEAIQLSLKSSSIRICMFTGYYSPTYSVLRGSRPMKLIHQWEGGLVVGSIDVIRVCLIYGKSCFFSIQTLYLQKMMHL